MEPIVTRKKAMSLGITRYHSGKPCPRGHDPCWRATATMRCIDCAKEYRRDFKNRLQLNQGRSRSGYAELRIFVHKGAYDAAYKFVMNLNEIMGVPSWVNDPPVEQDRVGIPREWARNPFEQAPAYLPVEEIEPRLAARHARGELLHVTMDALMDRHWPHEREAQSRAVVASKPVDAVLEYKQPDPEERHF